MMVKSLDIKCTDTKTEVLVALFYPNNVCPKVDQGVGLSFTNVRAYARETLRGFVFKKGEKETTLFKIIRY